MGPPSTLARQDFGRAAEAWAAAWLTARGRRILAQNWRGGGGELDIVAWHGPVLTFVEVRARQSAGVAHPDQSIGFAKRQRLCRAARHYLAHGLSGSWPETMRFDVLAILAGEPPDATLIEAAFVCGE